MSAVTCIGRSGKKNSPGNGESREKAAAAARASVTTTHLAPVAARSHRYTGAVVGVALGTGVAPR